MFAIIKAKKIHRAILLIPAQTSPGAKLSKRLGCSRTRTDWQPSSAASASPAQRYSPWAQGCLPSSVKHCLAL